jgi:hypothetical protein
MIRKAIESFDTRPTAGQPLLRMSGMRFKADHAE